MQYDLSQLDCDNMMIHPKSPKLSKFLEQRIPMLQHVSDKNWVKGFAKATVYRYILLMYDRNSPIQEMHSLDWYGKKFEAVAYAGFEFKKSKDGYFRFDQRVLDMVIGKNEEINDMVISFLGFQNNHKWNHIVYLQESLMHYVKDALSGQKTNKKDRQEVRNVYDEIERISTDLGRVYEETEEFVNRFYYQIEQSRLSIKPEDYAGVFDESDLRADSPYGVGYMVDKIKFVGDEVPDIDE